VKEIGGSQTESNADNDEEWEELSDDDGEEIIGRYGNFYSIYIFFLLA